MFPDTDPANRGRDSAEMLRAGLRGRSPRPAAGSSTSTASSSPSGPSSRRYKDADPPAGWPTSSAIAAERVGLKAKTGEGVGPIGREEAIAAQCVALLETDD